MGLFKKKQLSNYELEKTRFEQELSQLKPGSEEYGKVLKQLNDWAEFNGKDHEMKRHFTKDGLGKIVAQGIGVLGMGGLAFGLAKFEKGGNFFSSQSSNAISSIVKIVASLSPKFKA